MHELVASIIQGIVEGLTEFLPVSSTAHIILAQEFLGLDRTDAFWKMFTVVIQLGAILSVVVYFRQKIYRFGVSFIDVFRANSHPDSTDEKPVSSLPTAWYRHPFCMVMISFVVTAVPCFIIDKKIGENMERLDFIAWALILGGLAMIAIDRIFADKARTDQIEKMSLVQAIAIGLFQILAAAFPGTSRSMSTIAGGQVFGLTRSAALEFSFFLAIPVMFAAACYKLLKHLLEHPMPSGNQWLNLVAGFVTSFVVAYAVIAWFMQWVRTRGFIPFAAYRFIAGAALLWWAYRSGS
jgi:undecaprenyl-diphosphatase